MSDHDQPIEVAFDLTPEEWVEVAMEHSKASPLARKSMRDAGKVFALIVLLMTVLSLLDGAGFVALLTIPIGLIVALFMKKAMWWSQRRAYQRFAADGIANGMFGPHRVRLTEEGLVDDTAGYSVVTRWHAVERVEDTEGAFLIYTGSNAFLPIPHSAFRDSESLRAFGDRFFALMAKGAAGAGRLSDGEVTEGDDAGGPVAPEPRLRGAT